MLIKQSKGEKKKKGESKRSISCSSRTFWRCRRAERAEGPRVGGKRPSPPAPRALRPAAGLPGPGNSRVTPGGRRLVALRDRGATLHLCPPPGSEGGGCRGAARGVWAPRRGAAAGSARDGSPRPRPLAA